LSVVTTTTIMGDVTRRVVACGGGEVETLMPVGADPHDYAPSSAAVGSMIDADLVVTIGLGLESGLSSALESAAADGADVFEVGPLLDPLQKASDTAADPHVWMDVSRMARAASLVGERLAQMSGDESYARCGDDVSAALLATDTRVREILAAVPAESRVLITDHAAYEYFAQAYGFRVLGAVIPGGSTLAQPSSAELAALAQTVRSSGVDAIFANTASRTGLVDALAQEVGTQVEVVELYVGSLGPPGSDAEDYAAMMVTDAQLIADALVD
jgi:zinc/manganese transport system substrate-binding protein